MTWRLRWPSRRRRRAGRHTAEHLDAEYADRLTRWRGERIVTDTDIRALAATWAQDPAIVVYPPTPAAPLEPLPAFRPHIVPDVPAVCHCGLHAGHLAEQLRTMPLADIAGVFA